MVLPRFSFRDNSDRLAWFLPSSSLSNCIRICASNAFWNRLSGRRYSRSLCAVRNEHAAGFGFRTAFTSLVNS